MIIKVVLVVGLLVLAGFILRGRMTAQRLAVRRLLGVLVLGLGLVAILFPAAVTWLANRVGVGRGTDLLLYVLVIAFLFVSVALYQRLSDLEARYVALARRVAIEEASVDYAGPIIAPVSAADAATATASVVGNAASEARLEELAEALESRH